MVVPLIAAFQQQLPEVTLRTVDGLSSNLVELVGIGKLDCAVVYNPAPSDAAQLRLLAEEDLYLVSGLLAVRANKLPPRSLALADVAALPLVTAGNSNAIHAALASALAALGLAPQVVHQIENLTAILDLVRQGYGYSVIPLSGVHSCIGDPELRLHRIRKPVLRCSLSIATPARVPDDVLIERSTALLREVVRQQLKQFHTDVERAIDA